MQGLTVCRPAVKVAKCPAPIKWLHVSPLRYSHEKKPDSVFDCYRPDAHVGMFTHACFLTNASFLAALDAIMTICPLIELLACAKLQHAHAPTKFIAAGWRSTSDAVGRCKLPL